MKKIVNFGKSYCIEILFALLAIAVMVCIEENMRLYFLVIIIFCSIVTFLLYFILTSGVHDKVSGKKYNKDDVAKHFKRVHGYYPEDQGYTVVDFYAPYNFYIYAISKEVIDAYKEQQRILMWLWKWYVPILVVVIAACLGTLIGFNEVVYPIGIMLYVFVGLWIVLYRRLNRRFYKTMDLIKRGETIEFLDAFGE